MAKSSAQPKVAAVKWQPSAKPFLPGLQFCEFTGIDPSTGIRRIYSVHTRISWARAGLYAYPDLFMVPQYFTDGGSGGPVNYPGDDLDRIDAIAAVASREVEAALIKEGLSKEDARKASAVSLDSGDPRMQHYHGRSEWLENIDRENHRLTGRLKSDNPDN